MLKPNLDSKGRGRNRWRGSETVLEAEEALASPVGCTEGRMDPKRRPADPKWPRVFIPGLVSCWALRGWVSPEVRQQPSTETSSTEGRVEVACSPSLNVNLDLHGYRFLNEEWRKSWKVELIW